MRPLGKTQKAFLRAVADHRGYWYPGCGWYWKSNGFTIGLCEPLCRRGLLELDEDHCTYRVTAAGKLAADEIREEMRKEARR